MKPTTKRFIWGILAGVVLTIGILYAIRYGFYWYSIHAMNDPSSVKLPAPRLPPADGYSFNQYALKTLSDETYNIDQWNGKVVLLNVWATWCPGCVIELPNLLALQKKMSARDDVVVICVSDVARDNQETFLKEKNYTQNLFLYSETIMRDLGRRGIPATYIFDKQRNPVFHDIGSAKWDDDTVVKFLNGLADKK